MGEIFLPISTDITKNNRPTDPMWAWMRQVTQVVASALGITQLTGDVTAGPGSGSQVATISNNAVTFAKMQDINTQVLIGRNTAGSGDPEEISISTALDWLT